jgi:3-mercaptopyruvate sulfurtransferase SseA
LILIGAGALLLVVVLVVLAIQGVQAPLNTTTAGDIPNPEVPRIAVNEAYQAAQSEGAVIVDVRSQAAYEISHIEGSISIPVEDLQSRMGELDPQDWIITYCT